MPDILIRMEMPEGCLSCNLRATSGLDEWMCMVNRMRFPSWEDGWNGDKYRHVDCPLHELPEHGDLISRDDAIIDVNERGYDFWNCDADIDSAVLFLNEQPVIVPPSETKKKMLEKEHKEFMKKVNEANAISYARRVKQQSEEVRKLREEIEKLDGSKVLVPPKEDAECKS